MAMFDTKTQVDFLVIGAGAAGGVVAKELSTAGFGVVVLEQGPYLREKDFRHDELAASSLPVLTNDHATQPNTFRKVETEKATVAQPVSYGRCVGGGSVHYTGSHVRFHEIDFMECSRWGAIQGTGLADWPVSYADLEPYYTKAEWELGISGLAGVPFDPPRSKPYPVPPMPNKSSGVLFERAATKLGWHPFPASLAVISQPYRGRKACVHCGFCQGFGCEVGAKSSTLATVIPVAEKTGRCEIRPNSYVREISVDKRGRVTGAVYFDARRRETFQRAKAVVVCANGTETPRLLLLSKSGLFPQGLANSSGLVGKFLMFASRASALGTFEHPLDEYKGVQTTRVVQDFYDSDPKRGFFGGGRMDARFNYYPISFALGGLSPDTPRWGAAYKAALRDGFNHTMQISTYCTVLALETNNITLDPELKDAWGLPAMRVTYKDHQDDLKTRQFFVERGLELLDAAGAVKKWGTPVRELTSSAHLMGTCRMGNDAKSSVVDKFNRAHDVPNLFIVDGSSLVTCGRNHPTATIQALAYRAADHMIRAARKGSIPSAG